MSLLARTGLVAALSLNLLSPAVAADSVRLSSLAAASGYTYQWLATENGVSLQRPGIVIVLHAGYPLYEVNASPSQADRAPTFERGDLFVSPALASRLRKLAIAYPQPHLAPQASIAADGFVLSLETQAAGTITITARQLPGQEALAVSGTAPARAPITLTLTTQLSTELPTVVLNRTTVMSAADGTYSAVASIGQDPHRGTTVAVTASSSAGVTPAVARIIIDAPSAGIHSILDEFPPK